MRCHAPRERASGNGYGDERDGAERPIRSSAGDDGCGGDKRGDRGQQPLILELGDVPPAERNGAEEPLAEEVFDRIEASPAVLLSRPAADLVREERADRETR